MKFLKNSWTLHLRRLMLLITFLFLWEALAGGIHPSFSLFDPFYSSSPTRIARELYVLFFQENILKDILITLGEAFAGLVIGIASGVALGLIFAYSEPIASTFEPLMSALNSIPRPALAPLVIFWFGIGIFSKIFLAWSIVFFVIFYNTYLGIKSIDPDILNVMRVMNASRFQTMRIVILPSVASWIFAGLRLSISYALIGAIIGEFVGATAGIGYQLIYAEGLLMSDRLYALVLIIAVMGATLVEITKRVESKLLRWRPEVIL
ncbi:MAG: ABC transporter permease [Nitrososphaerota archaeon]|nr:ABC transporter permease [Aigarchaeota archaeon]MDW8076478.1 ABC transporter permease [Nitrososphaerota archaeon]